MKKVILVFGSLSGLVAAACLSLTLAVFADNREHGVGDMLIGYAGMLLAFLFIFFGIKNFRDKHNGGFVSFGQAFKIGLLITLITSTCYVIAWLIAYYCFMPDFMDKYAAQMIEGLKHSGKTGAEMDVELKEISSMQEMYKSPLFVILFTYLEILPVGLFFSLIYGLVLKRKQKETASV